MDPKNLQEKLSFETVGKYTLHNIWYIIKWTKSSLENINNCKNWTQL